MGQSIADALLGGAHRRVTPAHVDVLVQADEVSRHLAAQRERKAAANRARLEQVQARQASKVAAAEQAKQRQRAAAAGIAKVAGR